MGEEKLACTVFLLLILLAQGTVLANGNVIRLHVLANSDSSLDQRLKEEVRDRIIGEVGSTFAEMDQAEVAAWIAANGDSLKELAASVLADGGVTYPVGIKYTVESYPIRAYRGLVCPEGKYRSVQIILGEGRGRNWWCLLFPPLCLVQETVAQAAGEKQNEKIQGRFWFWEKIKALFQRLAGARKGPFLLFLKAIDSEKVRWYTNPE